MTVEVIGQMTKAELRTFVEDIVQEVKGKGPYKQIPQRPIDEILDEMWADMIELQPGQPSTLEMIREDRDR